jgi:polyphosphate kinase
VYLGSADLMERNLDRRVETLCRVRDGGIIRHIRDVVLEAYLRDNDRAYVLTDSKYTALSAAPGEPRLSAQDALLQTRWLDAAHDGDEASRR